MKTQVRADNVLLFVNSCGPYSRNFSYIQMKPALNQSFQNSPSLWQKFIGATARTKAEMTRKNVNGVDT